jgi:hypothetical protein
MWQCDNTKDIFSIFAQITFLDKKSQSSFSVGKDANKPIKFVLCSSASDNNSDNSQ